MDELALPDCQFCFYNAVLICGRGDGRVYLSSFDPGIPDAITREEEVLAELRKVTSAKDAQDLRHP